MTYLVQYKAITNTFPYERTMIVRANNQYEAINLCEQQVAKRPDIRWVRATSIVEAYE